MSGFEYGHITPHIAQIRNTSVPLTSTSSWRQIYYQVFIKSEYHQLQALQHTDQTGNQSFVHILSSEYTDYRKNHQSLTLWRKSCLFRICNLSTFFIRKLLSFGICFSASLECLPPSFTSEFECFTVRFIFQLSPSMQNTKQFYVVHTVASNCGAG